MPTATARTRILRACYSFLVPVARFLLRSGISFREFSEISRVAFVDVAGKDYGIRGRPTNISRVSAMTGIGRKEVSRVRKLKARYDDDPRIEVSPLTDVLHHWFTDPKFIDNRGNPKTLDLHGTGECFAQLVKECAGDRPVGAIRTELTRCGAVELLPDGRLKALRRYVMPENVDEKLINSLSFALRGLASTIAHNSNPATTELRVQRVAESEDTTEEERRILREVIREKVVRFSEEIDNLFPRTEGRQIDRTHRIGVGIYYYEDSD